MVKSEIMSSTLQVDSEEIELGFLPMQANRAKEVFRKYLDSVLQKSAKIRSLIGDLRKNYGSDESAKKCLCWTIWYSDIFWFSNQWS